MEIPVFLIKKDGDYPHDLAHSSPCVEAVIGTHLAGPTVQVLAMIDTGADGVYVDNDVVARLDPARIATEIVSGANHTTIGTRHHGVFKIGPAPIFECEYLSSPLRANHRNFDVVFGRSLFRLFDLSIQNEVVRLFLRQAA